MSVTTRRMGALALLFGIGLAIAPRAVAQEQRGPMGDPAARIDEEMEALTEAVGLSEEQVAAIRPLYEEYAGQMSEMLDAARGEGRAAMGELRPKLGAMRDEMHEQVRGNLNEDQLEPYSKFIEQRQEEMRKRRAGGPPSGS